MSRADEQGGSLEKRIRAARERVKAGSPAKGSVAGQAHIAWRMVVDLVVGVGFGAIVGLGLDELLGTGPVFIVVMTLLGFAAGIRLVLREASRLGRLTD